MAVRSPGPDAVPGVPRASSSSSSPRLAHATATKLNPHSASFSFVPSQAEGSSTPYVPYDGAYPISGSSHHQHLAAQPPPLFPPPPPPPYGAYPIGAANGAQQNGYAQMHPNAGWAGVGMGGKGAGAPGGGARGAPWAHYGVHAGHVHVNPYMHHPPPPPPQAQAPPQRVAPPPHSHSGIFLPLQHNAPHLAAVAAAAGYPQAMPSPHPHPPHPPHTPTAAQSPIPPPPPPPHPALLPPFSPQARPPIPPSTGLVPAPSLPVSPASPLPPPTVIPLAVPPDPLPLPVPASAPAPAPSTSGVVSGSESHASLALAADAPAAPRQTMQAPRGGIRRRRDHLPVPRDAEAVTFAPHIKPPSGFRGRFRVADSLKRDKGEAAGPSASKTGAAPKGPASSSTQQPASSSVASSSVPSTPKTVSQTPRSPAATSTVTTPPQPVEPATPSQAAAQPAGEPTTPAAAAPATPKSPAPAAAPVKRSWADLVRPPAGTVPVTLSNGMSPISASTSLAGSSGAALDPSAASTLSGLLSLPTSHVHSPAPPVPRGLINNGNLCFANAILQALVFCGDFWNFMSLVERGSKKDLREAMSADAGKGDKKSEKSAVEAMIAFLAEFRNASTSTTSPAFDPLKNASSSASSSTPTPGTPKPPFNNNVHPSSSASSSAGGAQQPPPLSPTPIHDALRHNPRFDAMRRGTQEDAEEFLGFFLETLHEEVLRLLDDEKERKEKGKGKEAADGAAQEAEGWNEVGSKGRVATTRTTGTKESPLTRIFGGKLRSSLRAPGQKDSVTIEPFQRLQLDIQPDHVISIEDALQQITTPEQLPDFLTSRGIRTEAQKQVLLDELPPVLILHLKRFLYDDIGGVQKSSKKVAYGTELQIDERVLSAPAKQRLGKDGARYELFGVVYHHGLHASGGHYTVAVRRGYHSTEWIELDDTHLYPLSPADVAVPLSAAKSRRWETVGSGSARSGLEEDGEQKNAYLLMYAKVEDGQ
ncbi:mRNA-binding ubiquitin-specific protease UBP3 [Rhodotorula paludigena]|uniref:mRNA-binding ubiquitin-specific protease UBP3 n=1 Tax=Rhodotorula paludigena TaxID=86838 RepID=UPI00316FDCC5